jgi:hypothetical protein
MTSPDRVPPWATEFGHAEERNKGLLQDSKSETPVDTRLKVGTVRRGEEYETTARR